MAHGKMHVGDGVSDLTYSTQIEKRSDLHAQSDLYMRVSIGVGWERSSPKRFILSLEHIFLR
jgi:hypothetical protein